MFEFLSGEFSLPCLANGTGLVGVADAVGEELEKIGAAYAAVGGEQAGIGESLD